MKSDLNPDLNSVSYGPCPSRPTLDLVSNHLEIKDHRQIAEMIYHALLDVVMYEARALQNFLGIQHMVLHPISEHLRFSLHYRIQLVVVDCLPFSV